MRVISSNRAGVGKTLVVTRLCEKLIRLPNNDRMAKMRKRTEQLHVTVPLHGTVADTHQILDALWQHPINASLPLSRIIHLDVSPSVSLLNNLHFFFYPLSSFEICVQPISLPDYS